MTDQSASSGLAALPSFGLYYPYIHFRDEGWLKVAALYWPKMARIVPSGYPVRDSDTVQALKDRLDFVVDLGPDPGAAAVGPSVEDFIGQLQFPFHGWAGGFPNEAEAVETEGFTTPEWGQGPGDPPIWGRRQDDRVAAVLASEITPALRSALIASDLARPVELSHRDPGSAGIVDAYRLDPIDQTARGPAPDSQWLLMHRDLAWIYKCVLSAEIARRNRLILTTDQVDAYAATSGFDLTDLARGGVEKLAVRDRTTMAIGVMALRAVVPANLAEVSIEQIITVRERHGEHFDNWRGYMDRVGADLAEQLADVESPQVLDAYLREAARRYAEAPAERLRRAIAGIGLDTAEAAVSQRFDVPGALAATGLTPAAPVGLAASAAVGVIQLRRRARQRSQSLRDASPAAYLLDIRETLTPRSWLDRILLTMRKATGQV
jgi:hypothetical protein